MPHVPPAVLRGIVRRTSARIFDASLTWDVQRRRIEQSTRFPLPPRGTRETSRTIAGVPCLAITCGTPVEGRRIMHLHGGGWVIGSPKTHRAFAARLAARTHSTVIMPDYRLAPEHPWPAALTDCIAVWEALVAESDASTVGSSCAISGDSAGGNLAIEVALAARDAGAGQPASVVLLSPPVDLVDDRLGDPRPGTVELMLDVEWSRAAVAAYTGNNDRSDPRISPINADLAGLPPMMVVAATEETLAIDADRLSEAARAAGVEVIDVRASGMWHVYPLQAGVCAESDHALTRISSFVVSHFHQPGQRVSDQPGLTAPMKP